MDEGRNEDDKQAGARRRRAPGRGEGSRPPADRPRLRSTPDPRLSRSLEYGAALLECFTAERTIAGVADLANALRLGRSTAHRYAATLYALGYLEQDEHRKYRLSRLALEPGLAALGAVRLSVPAGSVLAELRAATGHTVSMAVLDGTRAVYVHRLPAHGAGQHAVDGERRVGASLPLHCSALGKALLAALPREKLRALIKDLTLASRGLGSFADRRGLAAELDAVRKSGLALSDEELAAGARSVAAAVRARAEDDPVIAIDVTVPASAYTVKRLRHELGPLVQAAAAQLADARPAAAKRRSRRRKQR